MSLVAGNRLVTMTVYAEYMPEQAAVSNLPKPPAPEKRVVAASNVVELRA
jgi:hypothetical protein